MKRIGLIIGSILAMAFGGLLILLAGSWLAFRVATAPPDQPKFGYTGNWRGFDAFGTEERPLPPAQDVWKDYAAWKPRGHEHTRRVYLARLGGADRQSDLRSHVSGGDTPMGAQFTTFATFTYTDPTNGQYELTWKYRGKHDTRFFRFDNTYRLYLLQPSGSSNDSPPQLSIIAIEGIKPEHER